MKAKKKRISEKSAEEMCKAIKVKSDKYRFLGFVREINSYYANLDSKKKRKPHPDQTALC